MRETARTTKPGRQLAFDFCRRQLPYTLLHVHRQRDVVSMGLSTCSFFAISHHLALPVRPTLLYGPVSKHSTRSKQTVKPPYQRICSLMAGEAAYRAGVPSRAHVQNPGVPSITHEAFRNRGPSALLLHTTILSGNNEWSTVTRTVTLTLHTA